MSEDEEKRLKQLEDARKRVEELKNRRKKKDKKKKKNDIKTDEVGTEGEVEPSESNVEEVAADHGEHDTLDNHESAAENEENVENEEPIMQEKSTTHDATPDESSDEADGSMELSTTDGLSIEKPTNTANNLVSESDPEKSIPANSETGVSEQDQASSKPIIPEEPISVNSEKPQENNSSADAQEEASALFPEESSTFLSELERENDRMALLDLQKQVGELNSELRKLKFLNMEQETHIEELQETVQELQMQLNTSQQALAAEKQLNFNRGETVNQNASPWPVPPVSSPYVVNSAVDREAIDKWKNWNVDMTQWRSIGSGPIVYF
ncbi:LADA_0C02476g1_1 [Lachancea dasiensis]|uniref:LADA_0C02476g1_1 n=1 Tax=Lachancea dasiensis TaxID=1072105 RepID=A0A1G4IXZ9_9SACH|nr:LADA_0C02476g1_1 [Lachancea dasiensis]